MFTIRNWTTDLPLVGFLSVLASAASVATQATGRFGFVVGFAATPFVAEFKCSLRLLYCCCFAWFTASEVKISKQWCLSLRDLYSWHFKLLETALKAGERFLARRGSTCLSSIGLLLFHS